MDALRSATGSPLAAQIAPAPEAPAAGGGAGFAERMANALGGANGELVAAEDAAGKFAQGEIGTLETIVAMSKADLTLRHLVTLRNRALESLQEVLRLPL
jgi:flagellar hook-basal body complex protein FliE